MPWPSGVVVRAIALVVPATLLAATGGWKAGERYHRRVDRVDLARGQRL